ncbi:SUMF1/EgtB/PvdO family nonheme iron enzyme [Streptomyces collinus]|uniref:SUMF1/EgtB/PvdO family nonheme iron enzyme n=1 Tax=Streptomyces collinus TaxID=42684 RepID=UPI002941D9B2|nr:SUMF1/EgtB/PvdO family nonheme iron enzyme [Streptomyces collinus]
MFSKSPVDGKLMVPVEEGIFLSGPGNKPTWIETYLIDVYPTTNADYARFVRATKYRAPQHWPNGKCPDSIIDHPVVWVTWHDAAAYATGGRDVLRHQQAHRRDLAHLPPARSRPGPGRHRLPP